MIGRRMLLVLLSMLSCLDWSDAQPTEPQHRLQLQLPKRSQQRQRELLDATVLVLRRRVRALTDVRVHSLPPDCISLDYSRDSDLPRLTELSTRQGRLEFREELSGSKSWKTVMDGRHITRAMARANPQGGGWEVTFELDPPGSKQFAELTRRLVGKRMAIYFDGTQKLVATVYCAIEGGKGVITLPQDDWDPVTKTAHTPQEQAEILADCLFGGTLPVPLTVVTP